MKTGLGVVPILAAAIFALGAGVHAARAADAEPLSLSFLKFTVSDLPKMQAFYEKAFGMTQQKRLDNPGSTEVILTDPKGLDLALVFYKDGRKIAIGSAEGPIGFYFKDAKGVDDAYASAMAAGATSKSKPGGGGGLHVAMVSDPEGHDIELLHLP